MGFYGQDTCHIDVTLVEGSLYLRTGLTFRQKILTMKSLQRA